MSNDLDERDKKLLLLLDFNAKTKEAELAKELGITKEAVHYRIKKLEEKYFLGYHAIINNNLLGYRGFRFYLKLLNEKAFSKAVSFFMKEKNVWELAEVKEGDWDLMAFVMVQDLEDLWHIYKRMKLLLAESLLNLHFSAFRGIIQYSANFIYPKYRKRKKWIIHGQSIPSISLDDVDRKILSYLSVRGRDSASEVANRLDLPYKTVLNRIKRMEKLGIILGYRPTVNLSAVGLEFYKIHVYLKAYRQPLLNSLYRFSERQFHVLNVNEVINGGDFEMEVVGNKEDVTNILNKLSERFGKHIKRLETLKYEKIFLLRYFPDYIREI